MSQLILIRESVIRVQAILSFQTPLQQILKAQRTTNQTQQMIKTTHKTARVLRIASKLSNKVTEAIKDKVMEEAIRIMEAPRMKLRIIKTRTIQELVTKIRVTLLDRKALPKVKIASKMVKVTMVPQRLCNLVMTITKHKSVTEASRIMETRRVIPRRRMKVTKAIRIMETHRLIPPRKKNRRMVETAVNPRLKMTATL